MTVHKPPFVEGVHWERIPASERTGKWKYRLLRDCTWVFDEPVFEDDGSVYQFHDADHRLWMTYDAFSQTLHKGYAWDGATCAPDGVSMDATPPHDGDYQFCKAVGCPPFLTKWFSDGKLFACLGKGCRIAFWLGVRLGGWNCWGRGDKRSYVVRVGGFETSPYLALA